MFSRPSGAQSFLSVVRPRGRSLAASLASVCPAPPLIITGSLAPLAELPYTTPTAVRHGLAGLNITASVHSVVLPQDSIRWAPQQRSCPPDFRGLISRRLAGAIGPRVHTVPYDWGTGVVHVSTGVFQSPQSPRSSIDPCQFSRIHSSFCGVCGDSGIALPTPIHSLTPI